MIERCESVSHAAYSRYGGRSIRVCAQWHDPKTFIEWALSHGWQKGLHIDRIDNDGGYDPLNCRFITGSENSLRSSSPPSENKRKTQCKHGHLFDSTNTIIRPNGERSCRTCKNLRLRGINSARRLRRIAAGLCVDCGRVSDDVYRRCQSCRADRNKQRYRANLRRNDAIRSQS